MSIHAISRLLHIINQASLAADFQHQTQTIVDGISETLAVDVCSLYQLDQQQNLQLLSSRGLKNSHPVSIPKDKGLVGQVVKTARVINIIHPEQQPDYFYITDSDEARFNSFCGVPLIQQAKVVGVLVVQRKKPSLINSEDEAVLITLAAHLALLLNHFPKMTSTSHQCVFKGVSGAKGLAIGHALLCQNRTLISVQSQQSLDISAEQATWEQVQKQTLEELHQEQVLIEQNMGASMAAVLDAYQQLLLDPLFVSQVERHITAGSRLPWALKQTVSYFVDLFLSMEDPYLQARHEDIQHLGDKLYQVWSCHQAQDNDSVQQQDPGLSGSLILCGDTISVSDIVNLPTDKFRGIVCSGGAALSHVAVFANALGIPAVMGLGELPFGQGEQLIVDGDRGEIQVNPSEAIVKEYNTLIKNREYVKQQAEQVCHLPAVTRDGHHVIVMANSGLQADILPGLQNGADGIGLYRTELPFMIHANLPTEEEQVGIYRQVIDAYGDKPVCFRLLDIGGDKPLAYLPPIYEENPALGLRGIRFLLNNELILKTQIRAILRASAGIHGTQLLLPMITTTQELDRLSLLLDNEVQALNQQGIYVHRPALGVMVEVPGIVSMLPLWQSRLDFISIGSNDLSQYLLAIDRNNSQVASYYDPLHPGVLHELSRIVKTAAHCDLPLSVCGEMASDPVSALFLLGIGVRRISISAAHIPTIKWLIQQVHIGDLQTLVREALVLDNAGDIRKLGEQILTTLKGSSTC
jgi:phosphotransferase system enzyme I (PtsI)/phosphotransferase system enzyme I (PtsP)